MKPLPRLNIIGCGKLGQVLGRLWHEAGIFMLQDVLNRSLASGQDAVAFIGAGHAVADYSGLRSAEVWMIACPDDDIAQCGETLAGSGKLSPGDIVFHCSGALPSTVLQAAANASCKALFASAHPVRSFAMPDQTLHEFAGTWCGIEGDPAASAFLHRAFSSIGAHPVAIDTRAKAIYHAAAVFASNYLVTLLDVALQSYAKAGIADDVARQLMAPLVRGTVDNVFRIGPAQALTGPIARGDMLTAQRQQQALLEWNPEYGALYERFIGLTAELASRKKNF